MPARQRPLPSENSSPSSSDTGSPGPSILHEDEDNNKYNNVEASAKATEMDRLRRELDDSHQRIDRDTEVINNLHEKVTKLEELVEKQKVTISTQSRTISDRRGLRKHQQNQQQQSPMGMGMFPMTPSHHQHQHISQHQYPGSGASGISCPGSAGAGAGAFPVQHFSSPVEAQAQGQARLQSPQSGASLAPSSHCGTVFDQPPPKFEISFGAPYNAYTPVVPPGFAFCPVPDPTPNLAPGAGIAKDVFSPMAIVVANGGGMAPLNPPTGAANYHQKMADFSNRFSGLMRMSESFGKAHASFPNIFADSHLEDHVKDYLMAISSRGQASVLIGNTATRGFFVAKAINWYLIDNILRVTIIKGLDASVDLEIGQIQKQMTSDTPISVRHLMLTAMTTHLTTLSKKPNFTEFSQQKVQSHLTKLWTYVGPLSHDPANQNGQVWADLNAIITEAHSLAVDMYSMPLEYRFEFPEPDEHFDSLTMINRDPYVNPDPYGLKAGETRVRLGVTPIVRIRDNAQSPGQVTLMYLGHVLLKAPRKQILFN